MVEFQNVQVAIIDGVFSRVHTYTTHNIHTGAYKRAHTQYKYNSNDMNNVGLLGCRDVCIEINLINGCHSYLNRD